MTIRAFKFSRINTVNLYLKHNKCCATCQTYSCTLRLLPGHFFITCLEGRTISSGPGRGPQHKAQAQYFLKWKAAHQQNSQHQEQKWSHYWLHHCLQLTELEKEKGIHEKLIFTFRNLVIQMLNSVRNVMSVSLPVFHGQDYSCKLGHLQQKIDHALQQ